MNEVETQGYRDPELLKRGFEPCALSDKHRRELDEQGYTIFENVIDPEWLEALRKRFDEVYEAEGEDAGKEVNQVEGVRRLADLVNKGEVFDRVYMQSF